MTPKQKRMLVRIIVCAVLLAVLHWLPIHDVDHRWLCLVLYLIPYFLIGFDILKKAWKGIQHRQPMDECFLMSVATIGALALAVMRSGDFFEGVAVMLFYQIGEWFQSVAVGKSRRSIAELMDIRPDAATIVEEDGTEKSVDPDEVSIGSSILVIPGERIPIDGVVTKGSSSVDTSALTGESLPRTITVGDQVLSGSINLSSVLIIRTTHEFSDSTASRILDLVENASSMKSRSEGFITRFARVYTPVVCGCALVLAVCTPLLRILIGEAPNWSDWLMRALTFLVISCPCALVVSVPLTFFAGIGGASSAGVLVKGSNYLEALSHADVVVFDKTGTMTCGVFEVADIHHTTIPECQLLELSALAESRSSHPISLSLQKAWNHPIENDRVTDVNEITGQGVIAKVDDHQVACGNEKLMQQLGVVPQMCTSIGTVVHVAIDHQYAGYILVSDRLKPNAVRAIQALHQIGIKKTVMLTGDHEVAAKFFADKLDVDEVYASLLPQDKVNQMERLLQQKQSNKTVVFAGDGINDAPVLSRADIGIAMGALGSDAAVEAADIVLMDDDPLKISKAILIARKCMKIVRENICFIIVVKAAFLILSAFGLSSMGGAIFADVGVMILSVLNATRALRVKNL